jgi:ABC-type methionine transport system ATPase subunit
LGNEQRLELKEVKEKDMAKRRVMFTFPPKLIKEPIIYNLGRKFKVVTNIRRADVSEDKGWVVLELEGEEKEIDKGIEWVAGKGVRVDPVVGDIMEG